MANDNYQHWKNQGWLWLFAAEQACHSAASKLPPQAQGSWQAVNHMDFLSSATSGWVCRLKGESLACSNSYSCLCFGWLNRAVQPVRLTLLRAGHLWWSPTPGMIHPANMGLRVRVADVQHCRQRKTLAAPQAHFHSQPGLGAPLILLDKAQHGAYLTYS